MIVGDYELKVRFDVKGNRAKKELTMSDSFANAEGFLKKLLADLQDTSVLIDKFVPSEEKSDADV
jgi:hypothetical protein